MSGIYEVTHPVVLGGHAVKLLGWKYHTDGRLYWICQNQWGANWGEQGYFRIFAGQAGIDYNVNACMPKV